MTHAPDPSQQPQLPPVLPPHDPLMPMPIYVLLVINVLPELVLQLMQPTAVAELGQVFPGQWATMFFTYGVLHTGLGHLAVNMLGLWVLGRLVLETRTTETFFTFYLMATLGAAEMFALIGPEGQSTVGASGALFGLLGVYLVDTGLIAPSGARGTGAPGSLLPQVSRVLAVTLVLIIADLAGRAVLGTAVAWQAHTGGFLTGALMALASPPRYRPAV